LYHSCIALVWTPAIQCCNTSFLQLAENLQATCSSCRITRTAVVLRLCGLLQYNKIFVLFYCSCIALVQTALGTYWNFDPGPAIFGKSGRIRLWHKCLAGFPDVVDFNRAAVQCACRLKIMKDCACHHLNDLTHSFAANSVA